MDALPELGFALSYPPKVLPKSHKHSSEGQIKCN